MIARIPNARACEYVHVHAVEACRVRAGQGEEGGGRSEEGAREEIKRRRGEEEDGVSGAKNKRNNDNAPFSGFYDATVPSNGGNGGSPESASFLVIR